MSLSLKASLHSKKPFSLFVASAASLGLHLIILFFNFESNNSTLDLPSDSLRVSFSSIQKGYHAKTFEDKKVSKILKRIPTVIKKEEVSRQSTKDVFSTQDLGAQTGIDSTVGSGGYGDGVGNGDGGEGEQVSSEIVLFNRSINKYLRKRTSNTFKNQRKKIRALFEIDSNGRVNLKTIYGSDILQDDEYLRNLIKDYEFYFENPNIKGFKFSLSITVR